jgi:two-component system KDP operon response regulator KdpE
MQREEMQTLMQSGTRPSVLVVDDERQMRRFFRACLVPEYRVLEASTGVEGLGRARSESPDVVLVEHDLPDLDGVEFTRQLKRVGRVPILVTSARNDERSVVRALDSGADGFLLKPIRAGELGARIRVALRHAIRSPEVPAEGSVSIGSRIRVDLVRHMVLVEGEEVHLTRVEYDLMRLFITNADRVLTHHYLLEAVWGPEYVEQVQYLRVYMKQLRSKLEEDPARPVHLLTEVGFGYRLRMKSLTTRRPLRAAPREAGALNRAGA